MENMTKAFICAGQSNMAGGIVREHLPVSYLSWPKQVACYGLDGAYIPVEEEKAGPEVGMVEELTQRFPMNPWLLLNTPLVAVTSRMNGVRRRRFGNWMIPLQRRHCFPDLKQALAHAQAAESLEIEAFFWMQGERDSRSASMTANYLKHLRELIDAVRELTGKPALPVIIGRITPRVMTEDGRAFRHTHRNKVRQAQETFCDEDSFARLVDTDDLPQRQDALHFNTPGCLELGRRFARAYLDAIQGYSDK